MSNGGYAHHFHQETLARVLNAARGYRWRPIKRSTRPAEQRTKSDGIRDRIAENAERRLRIADAMKAEAGVVDHDLTRELGGGIAWTDRARILAPAGENRVQLATLAHECGHVFLHSTNNAGAYLPGHVKEMEAESYAHQAFAAHGMRMPKQITRWGRTYVGQWVDADRASGIAIDPRAEAYANGTRSPYEPLRMVPATWNGADPVAWNRQIMATTRRRTLRRAVRPMTRLHGFLEWLWGLVKIACLYPPGFALYLAVKPAMMADDTLLVCFLIAVATGIAAFAATGYIDQTNAERRAWPIDR